MTERHDAFIHAVTHELKTPLASLASLSVSETICQATNIWEYTPKSDTPTVSGRLQTSVTTAITSTAPGGERREGRNVCYSIRDQFVGLV